MQSKKAIFGPRYSFKKVHDRTFMAFWPYPFLHSHLFYGPLSISDMDRCCEKLAVMMMTLKHDMLVPMKLITNELTTFKIFSFACST